MADIFAEVRFELTKIISIGGAQTPALTTCILSGIKVRASLQYLSVLSATFILKLPEGVEPSTHSYQERILPLNYESMTIPMGLEPTIPSRASGVTGRRSNQLNYGTRFDYCSQPVA